MMDKLDIHDCIKILNDHPKWFFRKENVAAKLLCLETIQRHGVPSNIYYLIPFLKSDDNSIREKAAEVILSLFGKLKSNNDLTNSLRQLNVSLSDLDTFRNSYNDTIYIQLLGIFSLNSDGFIREKAILEFVRLKSPHGIRFILIRLNDWVLQVREAAKNAIFTFLNEIYIYNLLKELPAIESILRANRVNLKDIHFRIIQFILSRQFLPDFENEVEKLDDKSRLCFYKYLFEYTTPDTLYIGRIIKDKNFLIRLQVIKALPAYDIQFQKRVIADFLHDPSAKVRLNALYATKQYQPEFDNAILALISDEHASVRDLSRHLLKPKRLDYPSLYRARIEKKILLAGSLLGLSEIGSNVDLPIFEHFIKSKNHKLVIGSLRAINRFDSDLARAYSLSLFIYSTKAVRVKLVTMLARPFNFETLQKMRQIYLDGDVEIRMAVLKYYGEVGGWYIIGDLLLSLTDESIEIQNIAWQLLGNWKTKAVRLFTKAPLNELKRANCTYQNLLGSGLQMTPVRSSILKDLQFYLR